MLNFFFLAVFTNDFLRCLRLPTVPQMESLTVCLAGWLVVLLLTSLIGWLDGWSVAWLGAWLVGWLFYC